MNNLFMRFLVVAILLLTSFFTHSKNNDILKLLESIPVDMSKKQEELEHFSHLYFQELELSDNELRMEYSYCINQYLYPKKKETDNNKNELTFKNYLNDDSIFKYDLKQDIKEYNNHRECEQIVKGFLEFVGSEIVDFPIIRNSFVSNSKIGVHISKMMSFGTIQKTNVAHYFYRESILNKADIPYVYVVTVNWNQTGDVEYIFGDELYAEHFIMTLKKEYNKFLYDHRLLVNVDS